jgi:hypothetical protein
MRKTLAFVSIVALGLMAVHARAHGTRLTLHDVLSVGLSEQPGSLKWGISKSEIQQLYPQVSEAPAVGFPGFRFRGTLRADGCTFDVYLQGESDRSDHLALLRLEYKAGALPDCKSHLEKTLQSLYGPPSTHQQGNWVSHTSTTTLLGPDRQSSWRSATTCLDMTWKEGAGYHGSPLTLAMGDDRQGGCGYTDEVVPVHTPH